jgi:hypothetical protein
LFLEQAHSAFDGGDLQRAAALFAVLSTASP